MKRKIDWIDILAFIIGLLAVAAGVIGRYLLIHGRG